MNFDLQLAAHKIPIAFRSIKTRMFFPGFLVRSDASEPLLFVSDQELGYIRAYMDPDLADEQVESKALMLSVSKKLLKWDTSIYHAVAFLWEKKAWLLTAPSGTGKTTQYMNWERLFPGEITMICGDMPVIESRKDGTVWVWSSPWRGKENLGNKISAPLGGIVLLEQGQSNGIRPIIPSEAIIPLMEQFIARPDSEEQVKALCRLTNGMLSNAFLWKYVNVGDDASTIMLRETILSALNVPKGGEADAAI